MKNRFQLLMLIIFFGCLILANSVFINNAQLLARKGELIKDNRYFSCLYPYWKNLQQGKNKYTIIINYTKFGIGCIEYTVFKNFNEYTAKNDSIDLFVLLPNIYTLRDLRNMKNNNGYKCFFFNTCENLQFENTNNSKSNKNFGNGFIALIGHDGQVMYSAFFLNKPDKMRKKFDNIKMIINSSLIH